jgi:hypothetical protein
MGGGECTRCRVQDRRVPGIQTDVVAFGAPSERSEMTSFQDDDIETRSESGEEGGSGTPSDADDQDSTDSTDDADSTDSDTDSTDADTDSTDPS